jgi:hypothetical protein
MSAWSRKTNAASFTTPLSMAGTPVANLRVGAWRCGQTCAQNLKWRHARRGVQAAGQRVRRLAGIDQEDLISRFCATPVPRSAGDTLAARPPSRVHPHLSYLTEELAAAAAPHGGASGMPDHAPPVPARSPATRRGPRGALARNATAASASSHAASQDVSCSCPGPELLPVMGWSSSRDRRASTPPGPKRAPMDLRPRLCTEGTATMP